MNTIRSVLYAPEIVEGGTLPSLSQYTLGYLDGDTLGSVDNRDHQENVADSFRHKTFVRVRSLYR